MMDLENLNYIIELPLVKKEHINLSECVFKGGKITFYVVGFVFQKWGVTTLN